MKFAVITGKIRRKTGDPSWPVKKVRIMPFEKNGGYDDENEVRVMTIAWRLPGETAVAHKRLV
jgi:hypothetical protein